jgi:hypothetical protein
MHFDNEQIAPPGQHPYDPPKANVDSVGYALERLQTYLIWSEEHRASYEKAHKDNPADADYEKSCLKDAIEQAILHLQRLTALVLALVTVWTRKKSLPKVSVVRFGAAQLKALHDNGQEDSAWIEWL